MAILTPKFLLASVLLLASTCGAADEACIPAVPWSARRWCVLGATAAVAVQAVVIALLVRQVRRRRAVERALAEANARLSADIAANVAALRRSEALYREVVENARSIILRWGADGRILFINDHAQEFFGWRPDELVGRHVLDTIVPETESGGRDLRPLMEDICRDPGKWRLNINENRRRDGSRLWVAWTNRPVIGPDGKVVEVFSVGTDISERKRLEAELTAAKERAEAGDRAKMLFLATMSHEIRTPMNGVLGLSELLLAGELAPSQRELALSLYRSGEALLAILDEILDYSKLEAGRTRLELIAFDPAAAARDVAELFRGRLAPGVALEVAVPASPQVRLGDPARLRQVLVNLVGNAVKFTTSGRVVVAVEESPGGIRLRISDTGPGIPLADQEGLFRPFTQADSGAARRHGGTGLGLAISKRLVDLMGGAITLDSRPGEGTTIAVDLPLPATTDAPAQTSRRVVSPAPRRGAGGCRVLLVEDNPVNQAVARGMLEHLGAEVAVAGDGAGAATRAAQEDFDLVLMDLHLPDMDGCDAVQRIRALGGPRARVPVVALTASALPEDRARCLAAGMDGHLAKPVAIAGLAQLLDRWVESRPRPEPAAPPDHASPFDPSRLAELEQALGGAAPLAGVLAEFRTDSRNLGARIAAALAAADLGELGRVAHQLKGAAGTAGAMPVHAAAAAVVEAVRTGRHPARECGLLVEELARMDAHLAHRPA